MNTYEKILKMFADRILSKPEKYPCFTVDGYSNSFFTVSMGRKRTTITYTIFGNVDIPDDTTRCSFAYMKAILK